MEMEKEETFGDPRQHWMFLFYLHYHFAITKGSCVPMVLFFFLSLEQNCNRMKDLPTKRINWNFLDD